MVGYGEIAPAVPLVPAVVPPVDPLRLYLRQVRAQLAAQGFTEVYNYSFLNENDARRFSLDIADHAEVRNPIASDLTHLRRSLLPGVFKNVVNNVRHFREFRLFEIGHEIHSRPAPELPDEITHAAAVLYNAHGDEQDFFELKRVVECLFPGARLFAADARPYEHPVRTASIEWRGATLGRLFELHPSLLQQEGIEGRAFLFDVNLELAQRLDASHVFTYAPPRRYPTSGFDLSIVTALKTPVDDVRDALLKLAGSELATVEFIRQYQGAPLAPGQKSVSYHLEVGALDHTLDSGEVAEIRNRIISGMRERGFELRI